jgi:multiple antibiotic resistance protein
MWAIDINELITVSFTLFAVIDIVGNVPILVSMQQKMGEPIHALKATLVSGALMILFFFTGNAILSFLGVRVQDFAVAGSIVIFLLGLEMVLGLEFFKSEGDAKSGNLVPIAFPLIAGSGTLTTIMSLKATFEKKDKNELVILIAIVLNLIVIFLVLKSLKFITKLLGKNGLTAVRKFFGVILVAIAVRIFTANAVNMFVK